MLNLNDQTSQPTRQDARSPSRRLARIAALASGTILSSMSVSSVRAQTSPAQPAGDTMPLSQDLEAAAFQPGPGDGDGTGTLYAQSAPSPVGQTGAQAVPAAPAALSLRRAIPLGLDPTQLEYRKLSFKNDVIILPPPSQTIDGDLFGLRKTLADYGIGYEGIDATLFESNLLHSEKLTGKTQTYIGQQPTADTSNLLFITYDLTRYGIPDGQLVAGGYEQSTSYTGTGPNAIKFTALSYYQSAFNDHVEVKLGLINNSFEYVGAFVGGNFTSTFGPAAAISAETGQSGSFEATYGANVKFKFPGNFYDKVGIARSVNPGGPLVEDHLNPSGLNFKTTNTGAYFIDEAGYRVRPSPTQNAVWIRLGMSDSTARYTNYDSRPPFGLTTGNYAAYILGDVQVLRLSNDPRQAFRGVYVGGSAEFAQSQLAPFYNYFEGRIFALGPINGRPYDLVSLVATDNQFSRQLVQLERSAHLLAHTSSTAVTGAYSFNVARGLFVNLAVGYTDNPTVIVYNSKTGSSLNITTGVALYF